jgi:hypothetical protein
MEYVCITSLSAEGQLISTILIQARTDGIPKLIFAGLGLVLSSGLHFPRNAERPVGPPPIGHGIHVGRE